MSLEAIKSSYRRMLNAVGEQVPIRRYSGAGATRTYVADTVIARVLAYDAAEIIGLVQQGDQKLIVLAEDLATGSFADGVRPNDKAVVRGRELNIEAVDDNTRRVAGVLIAYELQVRG